jgi:hypothetical protein
VAQATSRGSVVFANLIICIIYYIVYIILYSSRICQKMSLDPSNDGVTTTLTLINGESPTDTSVTGRAKRAQELNIGSEVRVTIRNPQGKMTLDIAENILEKTNPFCRYVKEKANVVYDGYEGTPSQTRTYTLFDTSPKLKQALLEGKLQAPQGLHNRQPGSVDIDFAHPVRKSFLVTFEDEAPTKQKQQKRDKKLNELFKKVGVPDVAPLWTNNNRTRYNAFVDEQKLEKILNALGDVRGQEHGFQLSGSYSNGLTCTSRSDLTQRRPRTYLPNRVE